MFLDNWCANSRRPYISVMEDPLAAAQIQPTGGTTDDTRSLDLHGWRHTGDVGVKNERGFITIVDRIKDINVTGGFNVFPAPIEKVILEHEAVQECAVVGVPDAKWGEAVKAVVEPSRAAGSARTR